MRKVINIVIIFITVFLGMCKYDSKTDFDLPTTSEYNEIICEILKQDTIFSKSKEKILINSYLLRNRIHLYLSIDSSSIGQPIMFANPNVWVWVLMQYHLTNPLDFKHDSLYLSLQNQIADNIILKEKCDNILFISENSKELEHRNYLQFTVPILNHKKEVAFVRSVQINTCTPKEKIYVLEKMNGSWKLKTD